MSFLLKDFRTITGPIFNNFGYVVDQTLLQLPQSFQIESHKNVQNTQYVAEFMCVLNDLNFCPTLDFH